MTVTAIRHCDRSARRATPEKPDLPRLTEVETHIEQVRAALEDPQGWDVELTAELDRLVALRDDLLAQPTVHILAA